jgi:hypothetical protein
MKSSHLQRKGKNIARNTTKKQTKGRRPKRRREKRRGAERKREKRRRRINTKSSKNQDQTSVDFDPVQYGRNKQIVTDILVLIVHKKLFK